MRRYFLFWPCSFFYTDRSIDVYTFLDSVAHVNHRIDTDIDIFCSCLSLSLFFCLYSHVDSLMKNFSMSILLLLSTRRYEKHCLFSLSLFVRSNITSCQQQMPGFLLFRVLSEHRAMMFSQWVKRKRK